MRLNVLKIKLCVENDHLSDSGMFQVSMIDSF